VIYLILGNPESTQTCRVFSGETARECADAALQVLPAATVARGVLAADLGEFGLSGYVQRYEEQRLGAADHE